MLLKQGPPSLILATFIVFSVAIIPLQYHLLLITQKRFGGKDG